MAKIENSETGPAAQFLQLAAEAPGEAKRLVLWALQGVVERAAAQAGAFEAGIEFIAHLPGDGCRMKLKLLIDAVSTELVSEIVTAANDDLRVEPKFVVSPSRAQARFVIFIGTRIVGQMFSTRDGRRLRLDVEELPNAKDLGNDVVALEEVPFTITVLG